MRRLQEDTPYTVGWAALLLAGAVLEREAVRRRAGKRATLSAHTWHVLGERYSYRWLAGALGYGVLGKHLFYARRGLDT